jgi:hypothetical protein
MRKEGPGMITNIAGIGMTGDDLTGSGLNGRKEEDGGVRKSGGGGIIAVSTVVAFI